MFAGHCDQIGMIVQHIDDEGFIYAQPIGGWDPQVLIGQPMTVWTAAGPVPGIIARKPIHLLTEEERKQVQAQGFVDRHRRGQTRRTRPSWCAIGDPVTMEFGLPPMLNDCAFARRWTTSAGCGSWSRPCGGPTKRKLDIGLYCGLDRAGGDRPARRQTSAFGIDPQVGIAVDVTHATDCPTVEKSTKGTCGWARRPGDLSRAEHEPASVVERLVAGGREGSRCRTRWPPAAAQRRTDANAMQVNRAGRGHRPGQHPNRYMHSPVETISLTDIDHAANLLAGFALSVKSTDDFTP